MLELMKDSQNKLEHPLNFGNFYYQLPVIECECRMLLGLDCSYVRNLQYGVHPSLEIMYLSVSLRIGHEQGPTTKCHLQENE